MLEITCGDYQPEAVRGSAGWVRVMYLREGANFIRGEVLPGWGGGPCGPSDGWMVRQDLTQVGYRVRFGAVVICIFE